MQFQSRKNRGIWIGALASLAFDVFISTVASFLSGNGFIGAVVVFGAIQLAALALWIKNSIWLWLYFSYVGRKRHAAHIFDYLNLHKFPEPRLHEESAEGYLQTIVEDGEIPVETRILAAAELGALKFPMSQGMVQSGIRLSLAFEDALERYKNSFVPAQNA